MTACRPDHRAFEHSPERTRSSSVLGGLCLPQMKARGVRSTTEPRALQVAMVEPAGHLHRAQVPPKLLCSNPNLQAESTKRQGLRKGHPGLTRGPGVHSTTALKTKKGQGREAGSDSLGSLRGTCSGPLHPLPSMANTDPGTDQEPTSMCSRELTRACKGPGMCRGHHGTAC